MNLFDRIKESKAVPIILAIIAFAIVVYLFTLPIRTSKPTPSGPGTISKTK